MNVTYTLYSPFHGHLGVRSLGSSKAVAMNICVQSLCGCVLSFLSSANLGESMACLVTVCLTFEETAKLFQSRCTVYIVIRSV